MNVRESYSRALEQGPLELAAAAIDISISSSAVNYGRDGRNFRERGRAHQQHEFWVSFSEAVSATNEGSHGVFEPKARMVRKWSKGSIKWTVISNVA